MPPSVEYLEAENNDSLSSRESQLPTVFHFANHPNPSDVPAAGMYSQPIQPSSSQLIDQIEQIGIIHLTRVRLVSVRHARYLEMTNDVRLFRIDQIFAES